MHANHRHTTNAALGGSGRDLGMLAILLHVVGDAINNIAVIASAAAIWWGTTERRFYADPAVSLGISLMIFATSIPIAKNSGRILLQSSPIGVDLAEVKEDLENLPGVSSVHELHIWRLNQQKTIASAHVVTEDDSLQGFIERAKQIGECLHSYGVHSYTLQPEPKLGSRRQSQTVAGADTSGVSLDGATQNGDNEVDMGQVGQRGLKDRLCRLKCEEDACKDLQCCDD